MKSKNIAIAGEITPSKTIIPIIERLRQLEKEDKLNFKINKIIGLYHGESSKAFLEPYSNELFSIGEGRRGKKNSTGKLAYLISKDILKSFNALKGKNIDLLITAGNAGDVRKAIVAANFLKIPVLHIEQDIYNPIEVISQANLVTVPSQRYKEYLEKNYDLKNVVKWILCRFLFVRFFLFRLCNRCCARNDWLHPCVDLEDRWNRRAMGCA